MSKSSRRRALSSFLLSATAGLITMCLPNSATAQGAPAAPTAPEAPEAPEAATAPAPEPAPASEEQELSDEGIADESDDLDFSADTGTEEMPNDPTPTFSTDGDLMPKARAEKPNTGYPTRSIDRPLNLPGGMVQVALEIPLSVDPFAVSGTLTGSYGITSEVEVGLQYSPGRYGDDFAVGRAVALQTQYLVTDFLAAELTIPMYLDPFAIGIVAAAPFRYEFYDKFAIVAGRDLLSIKVHEFLPSVENATQNDARIADRENNQIVPSWALNMAAGAIYQVDDKLALDAEFGIRFDDTNDATTNSLNLGLLYANSGKLDFGAKVGATSLVSPIDTLGLRVFLNVRL